MARRLIVSVVEPAKLADAVKKGLRRIEDVATGRVAGLSEAEYRVALSWSEDPRANMKLPNGERADLGTKLADYSLNPLHRDGQHKARVFQSTLGITLANQTILERALHEAAANSDQAEFRGDNGFGRTGCETNFFR